MKKYLLSGKEYRKGTYTPGDFETWDDFYEFTGLTTMVTGKNLEGFETFDFSNSSNKSHRDAFSSCRRTISFFNIVI